MPQINNKYAALVLIDILYEKGLLGKATYDNIQNNMKPPETAREEKSA